MSKETLFSRFHAAPLAILALLAVVVAGRPGSAQRAQIAPPGAPQAARLSGSLRALVQNAPLAPAREAPGAIAGIGVDHLVVDQANRVRVRVTAQNVQALLPQLEALGFKTIAARPDRHFVEGFAPVDQLNAMSALGPAGLLGIIPAPRPIHRVGAVTSQADFAHETDRVRATVPGLNGNGVRIGVLSDTYNQLGGAAQGIATGDLPPGINVVREGPAVDVIDEGRAMLELIHDLAPGAELAFATAYSSEAEFADAIRALADPGIGACDILVDDIGYYYEPFFQDGIIAEAVDEVVSQGVAYFSAAGNDGTHAYESTQFNTIIDPGTGLPVHDFDPGPGTDPRQLITIPPFSAVRFILQWDDPFYTGGGVDTDLDLRFATPGSNTFLSLGGLGTDNNLATQMPLEDVAIANLGFFPAQVELVIHHVAGPQPGRIKYLYFGDVTIDEHATNSSAIWGHPMAVGAMAVGAVHYFDQTRPAEFTSAGPSYVAYGPNGMPLASPGFRAKPDIAAVQGTDTTFFGEDVEGNGFPNFFGTSAAAPHAAAIAALVLQQNPSLTPDQLYARLRSTADASVGEPGPDRFTGAGLINAYDAIFGSATPAAVPFADGLESGVLSGFWETRTAGAGRIAVGAVGQPASGSNHLTMQSMWHGRPARCEAILHVNAVGYSGLTLSFRQKEFSDPDHPMSPRFTGSEDSDGIALSVDGVEWVRVGSLTGPNSSNAYQQHRYDLTAIAAANGLTLGPNTRIKFQYFGNGEVPRGGMAFDEISLGEMSTVRLSAETLTVSESAGSVTLDVIRGGDTSGPLQVNYATSEGTATSPADFTPTAGTFVFLPGETTKSIQIPIVADRLLEGDEEFTVGLSAAAGGVIVSPGVTQITITDDASGTAPSNLTATATSEDTVRLDWVDNCDNEDGFELERRVGTGAFALLTSLNANTTSYVDTGLAPEVTYTYRVRAIRGSTPTAYSNNASLIITPFRFDTATYNAQEASGAAIVRVIRSGSILTPASVQLKSTNGTAIAGTDFQAQDVTLDFLPGETTKEVSIPLTRDQLLEPTETFELALSNPTGTGTTLGETSKAVVNIADDPARTSPRPLTATILNGSSVRLDWVDNCANESSYEVRRSTGGGTPVTLATLQLGSTTYTDTTVTPGVSYTYQVRAVQGDLGSEFATAGPLFISAVEFEQPEYTAREDEGTVPVRIRRTGDLSITATLTYATADGTAVAPDDYVPASGTVTFAPQEAIKTVFVTLNNDALLEGNETFTITITSVNGQSTVGGTNTTATFTITDDLGGLSPSGLTASALSSSSIQLSWTDRTGNETGFEIQRRTVGGEFATVATVDANATTYTDVDLQPNTAYVYQVRAINEAGNSAFSNQASATTLPPAPNAPSGLTAQTRNAGEVHLSWTDNSLDEAGFILERRTGDGAFEIIATLGQNVVTYLDTQRSPGTSYTYRVRATNAGGQSDYSNEATVTIPVAPAAPTNLKADAVTADAIRLTWSYDGNNATGFKVERRSGNGAYQLVGAVVAGAREFTDNGAAPGVLYTYRVLATNLGGDSAPSNEAQAEISLQGKIKVSPAKLKFGRVRAGRTVTKTIKIRNTGKGTLGGAIAGLQQTGGDGGPFRIVSGGGSFTLARGKTHRVVVEFQANNSGNFSGVITITSTDQRRRTSTVKLSGTVR